MADSVWFKKGMPRNPRFRNIIVHSKGYATMLKVFIENTH